MSTSIWPSDYLKELQDIYRTDANQLVVFLVSPFNPKERYDALLQFCQFACTEIAKIRGIQIACQRGDTPSTPNVIHQDIWNYIQRSDAIIIDISEQNSNVMIELGVAMAIRDKDNVIIIQDAESEEKFLFDISPARYLKYHRNISGDFIFLNNLIKALEFSLAPAPYVPQSKSPVELPLNLKLTDPSSNECLLSPANSHRRILSEGIEFGSFYFFQYSWLTLGMNKYSNIRVMAEMRFTELIPDAKSNEGWMGIMLRSQHFYANYGHLIYVVANGTVIYTRPLDENGKYEDVELGKIQDFNLSNWVNFDLRFNESKFSVSINNLKFEIPVSDMPFRYNAGLVRFQTYKARACIKTICAEIPDKSQ